MSKNKAFTLIEIIMVMAIIIILMSMLFVGMKYISASSKEKATRVALANAVSLLNEYEQTAGLSRLPTGAAVVPAGLVFDGVGRDAPAIQGTALVFAALRSVPAVSSMMDKLPADQLANINDSGNVSIAPILLDAWNNPIIIVPPPNIDPTFVASNLADCYGLVGVVVDEQAGLRVVNPGGVNLPGRDLYPTAAMSSAQQIARLRHFRPFFVSAGPDGDFSTHDDNIYSFEN